MLPFVFQTTADWKCYIVSLKVRVSKHYYISLCNKCLFNIKPMTIQSEKGYQKYKGQIICVGRRYIFFEYY